MMAGHNGCWRRLLAPVALACLLLAEGRAQSLPPDYTERVGFDQRPGQALPLETTFRDDTGRDIRLGSVFRGRPVVLVLAYHTCPNLCTVMLNSLMESLRDQRRTVGRDFDVLIVSIDPSETPELAAAKKRTCIRRYGRVGSDEGWHLLTGEEGAIRDVAAAVGYRYYYDEASRQYAHPGGVIVVTPRGTVSQYLLGVEYPPKDLSDALGRAARGERGPLAQALLLLCYSYDPATGRYTLAILRILQIASTLTVLGVGVLICVLGRRNRRSP